MRGFHDSFAGFSANPLGGRIGRDQLGMLGFELLQLVHQLVEFSVADLRIVKNVIAIFVVPDLVAERFDILRRCSHRKRL